MSPRQVELSLRKQRLQIRAARQRESLAADFVALSPIFTTADRVRAGVDYLRRNPHWLVGAAVFVIVARPRAVLRWAQHAFFVWQASLKLRRMLAAVPSGGRPSGS